MANIEKEQAAGLRHMAKLLLALADDLEAGHAKYVRGDLDFTGDRAFKDEPVGGRWQSVVVEERPGKLPQGNLKITSDIEFLTGQPNT